MKTIVRFVQTVDPKTIIPIHTEKPECFRSIPVPAPIGSQGKVAYDGKARLFQIIYVSASSTSSVTAG